MFGVWHFIYVNIKYIFYEASGNLKINLNFWHITLEFPDSTDISIDTFCRHIQVVTSKRILYSLLRDNVQNVWLGISDLSLRITGGTNILIRKCPSNRSKYRNETRTCRDWWILMEEWIRNILFICKIMIYSLLNSESKVCVSGVFFEHSILREYKVFCPDACKFLLFNWILWAYLNFSWFHFFVCITIPTDNC